MIEEGKIERLFDSIRDDFNSYLGFVFEKVCKEFLWDQELPFEFTRLGRWWHKDKEIDIVALNEETREIAFFEVKWSNLDLNGAKRVLKELGDKSGFVDWNSGTRVEYFGLIAKRLEGKESLIEQGYLCYDLADMCGGMTRKNGSVSDVSSLSK